MEHFNLTGLLAWLVLMSLPVVFFYIFLRFSDPKAFQIDKALDLSTGVYKHKFTGSLIQIQRFEHKDGITYGIIKEGSLEYRIDCHILEFYYTFKRDIYLV